MIGSIEMKEEAKKIINEKKKEKLKA